MYPSGPTTRSNPPARLAATRTPGRQPLDHPRHLRCPGTYVIGGLAHDGGLLDFEDIAVIVE